jgi:fibronectin-binding autotransporter adhesin
MRFERETIATQGRHQRLGLQGLLFTLALLAFAGFTLLNAERANAGTTSIVNCSSNPNALTSALAQASDGDTLAIRGTCTGTFEIAHSLTIKGLGTAALDGQSAGTVVTVDSGLAVELKNLSVRGGGGSGVFPETVAGGISNLGTLTLRNVSVDGNIASGDGGTAVGGILNAGTLTLRNSAVNGNSGGAVTAVGGIINHGTLRLKNSAVTRNTASTGPGGLVVAGILSDGTLTLRNSNVSRNSTTGDAFLATGGILNGGTLTLRNSSVDGNSASEPFGGGQAVGGIDSGGTLTLRNSSVDGNTADGSSFDGSAVGGIRVFGTASLRNSRVSQNSASAGEFAVGGIFVGDGPLTLRNSSVSENNASPALGATVGGIGKFFTGTVSLLNSRVVNNIPNNCNFSDPDCA